MSAVATAGLITGTQPRTYQAGAAGMTRGTALMQGADDNHLVPATAGAQAIGVLAETPVGVGSAISVTRFGEADALCGAPIVAPALLIADAAGHLVPSTAAGDKIVGYAVTSATVAGDQFIVFVLPSVR